MRSMDWLGGLFWPDMSCTVCGGHAADGSWDGRVRLCRRCGAGLDGLRCCPECTAFLRGGEGHNCRPVGISLLAFAPYSGELRQRLRGLKYYGRHRLAAPLGKLAAAAWLEHGGSADCIVPVPLYAARARSRGYNQSELLAEAVGRELGLPVLARALVRTRDTRAQYSLSGPERRRNVEAAFAGGPDIGAVRGKSVLLLDDIITTGATMQSCAGVLLAAGADKVCGLAVAGKRLDFDKQ